MWLSVFPLLVTYLICCDAIFPATNSPSRAEKVLFFGEEGIGAGTGTGSGPESRVMEGDSGAGGRGSGTMKWELSGKILNGSPQRPQPQPMPPQYNPYYPGQGQGQGQGQGHSPGYQPSHVNNGPDLSSSDSGNNQNVQNHPSISTVDMQLLAAMEKLVGRIDKLDGRVKTLENVVYYLTANKKPVQGTCPTNFSRVDGIKGKCYHVSSLHNPNSVHDWKSATTECAKMNSRLVEMINFDDFHRISQFLIKYTLPKKNVVATDFWTGGLNPGLIWIWSESGQQVEVERRFWNDNDNSSKAPGCLKLSYSVRLNSFFFKGAPCSQSQNFICELLDNKISRALKTFENNLSDSSQENYDTTSNR